MATYERAKKKKSLGFMLIGIVVMLTMPLIGLLLYNNFYAIHTVREQVAGSYENTLNLYMKQIDANLFDLDAFINAQEGDLANIERAKNNDTDYYMFKMDLHSRLGKNMILFDSITSFFIYEKSRMDYAEIFSVEGHFVDSKELNKSYISDLIESGQLPKASSQRKWIPIQIGQIYYLLNYVQYGDVTLGALIQTDVLLNPLNDFQLGDEGSVLLANGEGHPISDVNASIGNEINVAKQTDQYYLTGTDKKYLVVGAPSTRGQFNMVAVIPDQFILAKLPYLQGIIWAIFLIALCFIPLGLFIFRKIFLLPLNKVLRAMKRVRSGDLDTRVEGEEQSDEFHILSQSFNSMMDEIQSLRINVYEEQISKQKEELQRLQLQVKPHFFLNTLNIIYNLAKVKNYERVQEMTISLIKYFRFMFRSNTTFVMLNEELEHTRNYLRIHSLRFPERLTWSVEAPEYLSETPIPPLIIQTFVENSIKYAVSLDEPIHISISLEFIEAKGKESINLRIQDNGPGFDDEVLKLLQQGTNLGNEQGEHTGIWNVQRRLKLLYGDEAELRFRNDEQRGGAIVELIFPAN